MSLPTTTHTLSTPKSVGAWIEYPFRDQGDSSTKIYHHTMQVKLAGYSPLSDDDTMTAATEKPINSPFTDDANAFYIGDSKPTSGDGLMVQFDRMFANIPQDRVDPNGFYAFEFPVVPGGISVQANSTSENTSYNSGTFIITINATLSAGDSSNFQAGDYLEIENPNLWEYNGLYGTVTRTTFAGIVTKSGNQVKLQLELVTYIDANGNKVPITGLTDNSPANYIVRKSISPSRVAPKQLNGPSIVKTRYIKTSDPSFIQLASFFELKTSTGVATTTTSATTVPTTTDDYKNAAINGEYIINAETESIRRWKGNIYEVSVIKVRPQ